MNNTKRTILIKSCGAYRTRAHRSRESHAQSEGEEVSNICGKFGHVNLVASRKHFALRRVRQTRCLFNDNSASGLFVYSAVRTLVNKLFYKVPARKGAFSEEPFARRRKFGERRRAAAGVVTYKQVAVNFEITWQARGQLLAQTRAVDTTLSKSLTKSRCMLFTRARGH